MIKFGLPVIALVVSGVSWFAFVNQGSEVDKFDSQDANPAVVARATSLEGSQTKISAAVKANEPAASAAVGATETVTTESLLAERRRKSEAQKQATEGVESKGGSEKLASQEKSPAAQSAGPSKAGSVGKAESVVGKSKAGNENLAASKPVQDPQAQAKERAAAKANAKASSGSGAEPKGKGETRKAIAMEDSKTEGSKTADGTSSSAAERKLGENPLQKAEPQKAVAGSQGHAGSSGASPEPSKVDSHSVITGGGSAVASQAYSGRYVTGRIPGANPALQYDKTGYAPGFVGFNGQPRTVVQRRGFFRRGRK